MTTNNQPQPDVELLEVARIAMRSIEAPEVPTSVVEATRIAMVQRPRRRTWRKFRPQIAAAAVFAIVLFGLAFVASQSNPSVAVADIAQRVLVTKTLRAKVEGPSSHGTLFASGQRARIENDETVQIGDSATGQNIALDIKTKVAYRIPAEKTTQGIDLWEIFRGLTTAKSIPIDDIEIAGKKYPGFKTATKLGEKHYFNVEIHFWIDPTTNLPIRLEIHFPNISLVAQITEIEFDVPLSDAMFDTSFPPGYSVMGAVLNPSKPTARNEQEGKLTIVPGVGIGDIKFGMSRQEIVALLGEPDITYSRSPAGAYLVYQALGLQLILDRSPHKLGMIDTNPTDASDSQFEFAGQTDKGIRIGSSRQNVVQSYGKPDSGPNPVIYKKLGLTIYFRGDIVSEFVAVPSD